MQDVEDVKDVEEVVEEVVEDVGPSGIPNSVDTDTSVVRAHSSGRVASSSSSSSVGIVALWVELDPPDTSYSFRSPPSWRHTRS